MNMMFEALGRTYIDPLVKPDAALFLHIAIFVAPGQTVSDETFRLQQGRVQSKPRRGVLHRGGAAARFFQQLRQAVLRTAGAIRCALIAPYIAAAFDGEAA